MKYTCNAPGPMFTKRLDVLLTDLMEPQYYVSNDCIAKFNRCLGNPAVKFISDIKRSCEIWLLDAILLGEA